MKPNSTIKAFTTVILTTWTFCSTAQAVIISLNIRDGSTTSNTNVTTSFGVASENTVVGNWTNTNSFGAPTPTVNLVNSDGVATGVSATILNGGGQQYWGAAYIGTPWNYGPASFTGTVNPVSVSFDNLNTAFPNGYYALVYVNGAGSNTGAAITGGSTTYYFQTSSSANTTPILITDTNSADGYDVGNYAKFGSALAPLTGDSITFAIPSGSVQSANAGIGGVQLVSVPEPTAALLGPLGLLGLLRRRR